MRQCSEAMEQHGHKLDDQNEGEKEHKHETDGLQLQILLADVDLWKVQCCFSELQFSQGAGQ